MWLNFRLISMVIKILIWSKVAKAFRKSMKVDMVSFLLFILVPISSRKFVIASVVARLGLKPNWQFVSKLQFVRTLIVGELSAEAVCPVQSTMKLALGCVLVLDWVLSVWESLLPSSTLGK